MTNEEAYYQETHGPTVEGDHIFFDDEPQKDEPDSQAMQALLGVVFELGAWSGKDPVKQYAARVVMRQEAQGVQAFAQENRVSDSFVRRRIREARAVIGSAADADK